MGPHHHDYIDRAKASRNYLTIMTKIRAVQSLGSALCGRNNHERAFEMYKKTVNEILTKKFAKDFTDNQLDMLQEALDGSEKVLSIQEKAWLLRSSIDTVYDACIGELNEVDSQKPPQFQLQIKNVINEASPYLASGNFHEGLSKYITLLKRLKENTKLKEVLSQESLELVTQSIKIGSQCDDLEAAVKQIRERLDRLYSEIRLPDVYHPSSGPQGALEPKKAQEIKNNLRILDFRQRDGSVFEYNLQAVDDKVMGGQSESNIALNEDDGYLKFCGTVSRSNRGGFASFRIIPAIKDEFKKIISDTVGIILSVKLLSNTNKRFKLQLANEAHLKSFNWQNEFILEPSSGFSTVYLDILSFWPTMFGHVLSSPGNVDLQKVDCLGIILSHVTVDGKENPDFREGDYSLAIESVSIVKES